MRSFLDKVVQTPKQSAPVLSGRGDYALYQESTHSLSEHKTFKRTVVLEILTGNTSVLPTNENDSNFKWIEPTSDLIWQRSNRDAIELWSCNAQNIIENYCIGRLDRNVTLHQVVRLPNGDIGVLMYSMVIGGHDPAWPHSTGRTFTTLPCVTFDQGVGRPLYNLWYLRISYDHDAEGRYVLSPSSFLIDVLAGSKLDFYPYSGAMPNISTPNCSISPLGIAFVARDKEPEKPGIMSCETYFVPLPPIGDTTFTRPTHLSTEGCNGWCAVPEFSGDGKSLVFLREVDSRVIVVSRAIFVVRDISRNPPAIERVQLTDVDGQESSLYPEYVLSNHDGSALYFIATEIGRQKLFCVDLKEGGSSTPKILAPQAHEQGSVTAANIVKQQSNREICIVVRSTFTIPYWISVLDLSSNTTSEVPGQTSFDYGLSHAQVSELWYPSEDRQIPMFVLRPSFFDENKKYPMVMLLHGGPFSAWLDNFFPRWSPIVFAEQGYIVLLPNFTGSTSYGRDFTAAVWGDIGGKPYRDLEACMDFAAKELPYVDMDRAVCVGGSFGGYMTLWIAGQALAKRFKALMAHAPASFGRSSMHASDIAGLWQRILVGFDREYDPGDLRGTMDQWDTSRYAHRWEAPLFLTHGERDLRCPVSNSLAAFTHCQMKGVESKLLVFPDESHFILKPENWYHWYTEVLSWVDKYAKDDRKVK